MNVKIAFASVNSARVATLAATASMAVAICVAGHASAAELASGWQQGHQSKARLVGAAPRAPATGKARLAGVEIAMAKGWKTYWRVPGDAGGVPPGFDWTGSENLAAARVLYPAPRRLSDKGGETIGYKDAVTFPVLIEPIDASKPVSLKLNLTYGICLDICVPAETTLSLVVPAADLPNAGEALALALDRVPRAEARLPGDPVLDRIDSAPSGNDARIVVEARFADNEPAADAFVEGPDGVYLSMPRKDGAMAGGRQRFLIDATADEMAAIKGKPLVVTLTGANGASEYRVTLP